MNRALASLALTVSLTACASAGPQFPRDRNFKQGANPSAAIAAELAFAQLAQDKGQWTAFRQTATNDAVMFVPQAVQAQTFLKNRANPPVAVKWQPHQVWSSCDGSIAVTRGAWQGPKANGFFTTVWQRQKDGGYKWVADQGEALSTPLAAPEMISAQVATCKPPVNIAVATGSTTGGKVLEGESEDGTLRWTTIVAPDCGRHYTVQLWNGVKYDDAVTHDFAAPPAAERPAGGCA